MTVDGACGWRL